jgi:DNA adenine methylase
MPKIADFEDVPATDGRDSTRAGKLTPPLKWHGGKHYVAKAVLGLMPRHLYYCEPYFGGGQVLFARDPNDRRCWWDGPTSDGRRVDGVIEVINDVHKDLMNFYAVLKDAELFAALRDRLEKTLHSEAEWESARDLLAAAGGDPVARAAALFTLCRQSLSGRMTSYAPVVRNRLRGGREDGVNGWWTAVNGLGAVHERLKSVRLLCRPAVDVIRSEDTAATLFYCDPPYYHATRAAPKVYDHEMSEADHREMLGALLHVKGKVILSGYANDLYDRALAGWRRHTRELPNNASGAKEKRRMMEVLWTNFEG